MRLVYCFLMSSLVGLGAMVAGCELFNDEDAPENTTATWVTIGAGVYNMGDAHVVAAAPVHQVRIQTFALMRTEVTVAQYAQCVSSGGCAVPNTTVEGCNWNRPGYEENPINCVSWTQAVQFCAWAGGRLPSESEWEYAAKSQGDERPFPWGMDNPSCNLAIMKESGIAGCGNGGTWPVCSKPNGKTDQGLCDMSGNVYEWVQDTFHTDYIGNVPSNGNAWEDVDPNLGVYRVLRGASYNAGQSDELKTASRANASEDAFNSEFGIRCAKSL